MIFNTRICDSLAKYNLYLRPSSFILAWANSRKLPCSTPDVTSGIGISRCTRYTRVHGGTRANTRATKSINTKIQILSRIEPREPFDLE